MKAELKQKCLRYLLLVPFLLVYSLYAAGNDSPPVQMLEKTSNSLITALKNEKASISSNPQVVYKLARQIALPHIDVKGMSRMALGRVNWKNADQAQRQQFINLFTDMMIRTYSSALAAYTDETVTFLPIRGGVKPDQRFVNVKSLINQNGGPSIPVSYRLVKKDSDWMVYDFSVDGVSLVQSFRSQFAHEIQRGGIKALITKMQAHIKDKQ